MGVTLYGAPLLPCRQIFSPVVPPRRRVTYNAALPLRQQAVLPRTAQLYRLAFNRFAGFVRLNYNVSVSQVPPERLDVYFERFIDDQARSNEGRQRQRCVNAMQGVFLVLGEHLRSFFPSSRRALAAWKKRVPAVSAPPIPEDWCDVLAALLILKGKSSSGFALYLSFHALLRPFEVLALEGSDILVDSSYLHHGGVRVQHGKTGPNQFARITDPTALRILRYFRLITPPHARLFADLDYRGYLLDLGWACRALALPTRFTPHSARHGGATKRFLLGDHPDVIRIEGRWSQYKSMMVYLQSCSCMLLSLNPPPEFTLLLTTGFLLRPLLLSFV